MNRWAKWLLERWFEKAGYTVIPHWRAEKHAQAEYLEKLFGLLEVDCVLDVGANEGQYVDFLRQEVGYRGTVVSFEPIPALGQHLIERAKGSPGWVVQPYALGTSSGIASFNVMVGSQFSSFLTPSHSATSRFEAINRVSDKVEVEVRALDDVLPGLRRDLGFSRPYLKLDTQGFDLAVLKGGAASLQQVVALQTEASVTPIYEGAPDFASVVRYLEGCGFALSGMFANNPAHFPLMIEFDCHMVNRARLPQQQ